MSNQNKQSNPQSGSDLRDINPLQGSDLEETKSNSPPLIHEDVKYFSITLEQCGQTKFRHFKTLGNEIFEDINDAVAKVKSLISKRMRYHEVITYVSGNIDQVEVCALDKVEYQRIVKEIEEEKYEEDTEEETLQVLLDFLSDGQFEGVKYFIEPVEVIKKSSDSDNKKRWNGVEVSM